MSHQSLEQRHRRVHNCQTSASGSSSSHACRMESEASLSHQQVKMKTIFEQAGESTGWIEHIEPVRSVEQRKSATVCLKFTSMVKTPNTGDGITFINEKGQSHSSTILHAVQWGVHCDVSMPYFDFKGWHCSGKILFVMREVMPPQSKLTRSKKPSPRTKQIQGKLPVIDKRKNFLMKIGYSHEMFSWQKNKSLDFDVHVSETFVEKFCL